MSKKAITRLIDNFVPALFKWAMPKRSKSRPSPSKIDREWPYQVALPDDLCVMKNLTVITAYCREHALSHVTHQVTAVWPGGFMQETYRLHCFAERDQALRFHAHFGGHLFDPAKDREDGKVRGVWRREGPYVRLLVSGPLTLPEALRN